VIFAVFRHRPKLLQVVPGCACANLCISVAVRSVRIFVSPLQKKIACVWLKICRAFNIALFEILGQF
jgi:hypothetical protein